MPTGKLYRNGLTMGMGGNPKPVGGKRGQVIGWSTAAVRRHTRWLYSVDTARLGLHGWSVTLTMRDCPPTTADWTRVRKSYLDALRRSGIIDYGHWVVEWQARKVPHLHMAIYFTEEVSAADAHRLLVDTWVQIAGRYGVGLKGQHLAPITGALGWLEYLSKHAGRGVAHYQRQGKPSGWDTTGRLWGHFGDWPSDDPVEVSITRGDYFRFRRLVRSWRVADARSELFAAGSDPARQRAARRRITSARSMLACADRSLSEVRGVSEWISEDAALALLLIAAGDGEGARAASRQAGAHGLPTATQRPKWVPPTVEYF